MSYSKFIILVFTVYVIYYVLNIIYDSFLKKEKKDEEDNETEFVIDNDETPVNVIEDDFTKEQINHNNRNYIDEIKETVDMQVETQGIPVELLYEKGKSMFAGINY